MDISQNYSSVNPYPKTLPVSFSLLLSFFPFSGYQPVCVHSLARPVSRSMETGLFRCQLQSALTCACNVVYCPNASPEEHLRRPLKFKAIYHHLPSSSSSPPCHNLLLPQPSSCSAQIKIQTGLIDTVLICRPRQVAGGARMRN